MKTIKLHGEIILDKRTDDEVWAEIDRLFDKVWYERKLVMIENMRQGKEHVDEDLMDKVTDAMRKVERKWGKDSLPAEDDFDWGMTNGKLSALRWVMGDEWDFLDT